MTTAYRTLMVDAGLDGAAEARTRLAVALARRFGARLIGLGACTVLPPMRGPFGEAPMVVEVVEAEVERVSAMLRAAEERFRAGIGVAGLADAEWRGFLEFPGEALAREARAADLLVIGRAGEAGPHQPTEPGDVLMRAGRPVLVVPPGCETLEARRVLVAWKEAREAQRAVIDALPFLVGAEQVVVLAVCEEAAEQAETRRQVEDVAAMLSRHGARAAGEVEARGGQGATEVLLRAAERLGADLVVAGGYGHARLLEWAFGGVTRSLLAHCPVCCLLSH